MRTRRWVLGILALGLIAVALGLYNLPGLVRRVAIARLQAITGRPVSIDVVELNPLTGRVAVGGFRIDERGEPAGPFASIDRLEARLHVLALLRGHVWLSRLTVAGSTVRVVRLPSGDFNLSDLIESSGPSGRVLDVTVDHFALSGGTVTLEDRALAEPRTWSSEQITIEARNVSTRRSDGSAVGRSVTVGSPVTLEIRNMRLYPVHLQATLTTENVDLTPLQVYVPPSAPILITRGRASTSLAITLDARDGLRVDATGRLEDVSLVSSDGGAPIAVVPRLTAEIGGFGFRDGDLQLARLAIDGAVTARDPALAPGGRPATSTLRASVADLTWPVRGPGRLDLLASIPGGGNLAVAGALQPPPAASQVRLRLTGLDLARWARFAPIAARITGFAEADLRIDEPLVADVPRHIEGSVAVNRLAVGDARHELLGARRVEARGLELDWPRRLVAKRLSINGPRGLIERDRSGDFPLAALARRPGSATTPQRGGDTGRASGKPTFGVEITELTVQDGRLTWRDETVPSGLPLIVSGLEARVTGLTWPVNGPLGVRLAASTPGGGSLQASGRVALDPATADLRIVARNVELSPYQPYVPIAARVSGAADADVAVMVAADSERHTRLRGTAGVARVDVRDGARTVARIERATATGLEVDWPGRVAIGRLALVRPWFLVERDERGGLPLRALLVPAPSGAGGSAAAEGVTGAEPTTVIIARLSAEDGGIRLVDRAVSPAFAVDLQPATLSIDGFSTRPVAPARVSLTGRVGASAELAVSGTIGVFGGPLRLDLDGELREFAVPRTNPYLVQQVGWQTRDGRLTTKLQCRVEGDALSARTDVRVSRLQLVRASSHDEAQARIGLPLGLITSLMKDRRGDITLSFPVGGRLSDPRFDFRDALWSAVRSVAINAITLPVSWIGRVQFTPDSRIERIQVDPLAFEPGTAQLTAEGEGRMARLAAFLEQLPDVTLALTPVVSPRDAEALRRLRLEAAIDRLARQERLSRDDALARLFAQQLPGRPAPDTPAATLAMLLDQAPLPIAELPELAAQRLQAVHTAARRVGIEPPRLIDEALAQREDASGRIELEVREPGAPRASKFRETLRRLGVPLKGAGE
jgi:Domain of Unknown Function (DUF748)